MWEEFESAKLELSAQIEDFITKFNQLSPYISKIGTSEDGDLIRREMQQLCQANDENAKQIREKIKILYQLITESERTAGEKRQYRLQAGTLLNEFLSSLMEFQHKQREIVDRQRGSIVRARSSRLSLRNQRCDAASSRNRNSVAGISYLTTNTESNTTVPRRISSIVTSSIQEQYEPRSTISDNKRETIRHTKTTAL